MRLIYVVALIAMFISAGPAGAAQVATPAVASPIPQSGDFAGMVDIGGRSIYLECRGTGSPTVILIGGYRSSSMYWTTDLLHPEAPRIMVLPGVAKTTRVCAYDRPGTTASIGDEDFISRSDPIAQPRAAPDVVEELHALLEAAGIPGPYVLAGHSMGGFFARLYAATYPDDVAGLVLVDAYSEMLEDVMSPAQWQALVQLNQALNTDVVVPIPGYGDLETLPFGADNAVVRAAVAASPLPPMPLAVLAHGKPFAVSADSLGFTGAELEGYIKEADEAKVALVPNTRYWIASASGHDIHQDQPELVTEAIQQVLEGVRNPDTWYNLESCCKN
jgi:pimeloyl-ACP methyl ester carboxylesterase